MILISRKVDYGILLLYHLMEHGDGVSAREMADHFCLSRPFVANILKHLCQEGFVESQRGVHGGYRLARLPGEINLAEVITALDGPFRLMSCAGSGEGEGESPCCLLDVCPVRSPLTRVHDRLLATLASFTLEDLRRPAPTRLVALTIDGEQA